MTRFDALGNTKIICTIGPATNNVDRLVDLIRAGMDVARLNFSHGTRDEHRAWIDLIRTAAARTGEAIAILQDLSGPKIRTGTIANGGAALADGQSFTFSVGDFVGDAHRVSTTYQALPNDVKPGDTILVDDGKMKFRVVSVKGLDVACTVVNGGVLHDKKGMNLPGVAVSAPSVTEKDKEDLLFGLEHGVDYVALSFVRSAADIRMLRELIASATKGRAVPVVAKIERAEAIDHLEEIVAASDAIMVARGDLGVELPAEEVPVLQKRLVRRCNEAGVPVIIATQMLESMIEQPRPTRAEANDVANAVLDGADAVMLSGETSVGKFPVEAVRVMDLIIRRAESEPVDRSRASSVVVAPDDRVFDAIARAANVLAEEINARAIIVLTHTGATAIALSKYRPTSRIVAVTDQESVVRRLNLVWGVRGLHVPDFVNDRAATFKRVRDELKRMEYVRPGDLVVFTSGPPAGSRGTTNSIKVETVD